MLAEGLHGDAQAACREAAWRGLQVRTVSATRTEYMHNLFKSVYHLLYIDGQKGICGK